MLFKKVFVSLVIVGSFFFNVASVKAQKALATFDISSNTTVSADSLQRLFSNYTRFAIQVRRSSNITPNDIGFKVSGDTNALKAFVGNYNVMGNCFGCDTGSAHFIYNDIKQIGFRKIS